LENRTVFALDCERITGYPAVNLRGFNFWIADNSSRMARNVCAGFKKPGFCAT